MELYRDCGGHLQVQSSGIGVNPCLLAPELVNTETPGTKDLLRKLWLPSPTSFTLKAYTPTTNEADVQSSQHSLHRGSRTAHMRVNL